MKTVTAQAEPYTNRLDIYEDYLRLLDAYIWRFLAETSRNENLGQQFRPTENRPIAEVIQSRRNVIVARSRSTSKAGGQLPILRLQHALGLGEFEVGIVMMSLGAEMHRKYSWIYGQMLGATDLSYPTIEIAMRLLCQDVGQQIKTLELFRPGSTLQKYVILLAEDTGRPLMNRTFRLKEDVMSFLLGFPPSKDSTAHRIQIHSSQDHLAQELVVGQDLHMKLCDFISANGTVTYLPGLSFVRLMGPRGAGKKLQVKTALRELSITLVSLNYADFVDGSERQFFRALRLHAMLHHAAVAVWNILSGQTWEQRDLFWSAFADEFVDFQGIVFVTAESSEETLSWMGDIADDATVYDVSVPCPQKSERLRLWQTLLEPGHMSDDVQLEEFAEKFQITPGQMKAALNDATSHVTWDGRKQISAADLNRACYRQVSTNLAQKAKRITPRADLDAVVLPDAQLSLLRQASHRIRYRSHVLEDWGFAGRLGYGTGVSMLFAGPPGTGKTMAAEALGTELRMPVYRIDLAQVVSKYIGETEKNLWGIFEEAKNSSAILFFDEADALFGKRTEVKDSHDKYANVETAFLLQKMEEFNGLSLLATNILQNIDEAFIRRFSYIIRFPFPDPAHRERIWRGMFPASVPLGQDVDFPFLAQKLNISGGVIKNIALAASFLAVSEQSDVEMKHLLYAARDELNKTSTLFRPEEMGLYADLFS